MLSKINAGTGKKVDLIFLDTLHHFQETHDLVNNIRSRYPDVNLHIFKPDGIETAGEFAKIHGENLWKTNDTLYDYLAKVEPAQRAYNELGVKATLTGRRRSQGGQRGDLDIVEVDDAGLIKVNPLANWSFPEVKAYVTKHNVPYNVLLDRGYKSVGDWHSTRFVFTLPPFLFFLDIQPNLYNLAPSKKVRMSEQADGRVSKRPSAEFTTNYRNTHNSFARRR